MSLKNKLKLKTNLKKKIEEEGAPNELFGAPKTERLRGFLSSTMPG